MKISIPDKAVIIQGTALEPYYVKLLFADGRIWLLNRRKKQVLLMNPAKKTAKITFIENQPPDIYEALSNFKNMPQLSSGFVGKRRIGETQAIGFRASFGQDQATVWFDSQTQLPIRIEFSGMDKCGQTERAFIWSEIVYDVELDESLFRFDLAGYKVEEVDSEWDWKNIVRLAWRHRIQPYKLKLHQQKYQAGLVWLGLFYADSA
jgi:RNAse (barnase) inhibitor barstar